MKNLIITTALLAGSAVSAISASINPADSVKNTVNYITLEQKHRSNWLDYAKGLNDAKFDIMKKHHNETMDLVKANIKNKMSGAYDPEQMSSELDGMIALQEKQMEEWKTLHTNWDKKANKLYESEKAELNRFKATLKK